VVSDVSVDVVGPLLHGALRIYGIVMVLASATRTKGGTSRCTAFFGVDEVQTKNRHIVKDEPTKYIAWTAT
jgi:hypothetical protein